MTEDWGETLFSALSKAGGTAFSNMAVGYNNVDVSAANKYGVAVGNTPVSLFLVCVKEFCFSYLNRVVRGGSRYIFPSRLLCKVSTTRCFPLVLRYFSNKI